MKEATETTEGKRRRKRKKGGRGGGEGRGRWNDLHKTCRMEHSLFLLTDQSSNSTLWACQDCPDPSFLTFKNTKNIVPATIFTGASCRAILRLPLATIPTKFPPIRGMGASGWNLMHSRSTVETSQVGIGLSSMITLSFAGVGKMGFGR